ncbi:MAG: ABC transporter permease [Actinobacteria bacterium]|nr:ABC transporter permease [Actinomycetota bacterium]
MLEIQNSINKGNGLKKRNNSAYYFELLYNNIIWVILILTIIVCSFVVPYFFSVANFKSIFLSSSAIGILVIAESLVLITGNFDLSIESTLGFTAVLAGWLMVPYEFTSNLLLNPVLTILIMLAVGAVIGIFNGLLIVKLKMNAFIVTIAMLIILRGAAVNLTQGSIMIKLPDAFTSIANIEIGSFPLIIYIFLFLLILFQVILKYTRFGRNIYAIGDNKDAAFASGINVDRTIIVSFILAGVLSAVAAWVLSARYSSIAPGIGQNMIFDVVAAAVIGGVSLSGGRGNLIGALGGILLLSIIQKIVNLLEFSPFYIDMIRGAIILLAIFIDSFRYRFAD